MFIIIGQTTAKTMNEACEKLFGVDLEQLSGTTDENNLLISGFVEKDGDTYTFFEDEGL